MATLRQIEANRANAKKSTGPRTIAGKARSSRNALRHGLSRPIEFDAEQERRIAVMVGYLVEFTGGSMDDAYVVAEARAVVERLEGYRRDMLAKTLRVDKGLTLSGWRTLDAICRYEERARRKSLRGLRRLQDSAFKNTRRTAARRFRQTKPIEDLGDSKA